VGTVTLACQCSDVYRRSQLVSEQSLSVCGIEVHEDGGHYFTASNESGVNWRVGEGVIALFSHRLQFLHCCIFICLYNYFFFFITCSARVLLAVFG
jgi:hypothetical protein